LSNAHQSAGHTGTAVSPPTGTPAAGGGAAAFLSSARRLLPDGPVPALLGGSALALAGVIEWPVVAGIGVGYVALRRWHRPA
jgi:hypothetical protein